METHILEYILESSDRNIFSVPKLFLPAKSKLRIHWQPNDVLKTQNNLTIISSVNAKDTILFNLNKKA